MDLFDVALERRHEGVGCDNLGRGVAVGVQRPACRGSNVVALGSPAGWVLVLACSQVGQSVHGCSVRVLFVK